ncbi:MAG: glycosyltransferase, partial [Acidimicrobiales bacterium]
MRTARTVGRRKANPLTNPAPAEPPAVAAGTEDLRSLAAPPKTSVDHNGSSRLWLVVPAYNEESRLGPTVEEYQRALRARDRLVIVVNGSVDRTLEIAQKAAEKDERLRVIVDKRKIGKGGAILAGYRFVDVHASAGDVVSYTDADAAIAGHEIVRFCTGVSSGELRVGSRWQDRTTQLRKQPVGRQIASRAFNQYVRAMLGLDIKDTQCSAKAVRVESLPAILHRVDSTGFSFDVDLIMSAQQAGLAITEVPVFWAHRKGSTVSMRRAAPVMFREVRRLRRKYQLMPIVSFAGLRAAPGAEPTSAAADVIDLTDFVETGTSTPPSTSPVMALASRDDDGQARPTDASAVADAVIGGDSSAA